MATLANSRRRLRIPLGIRAMHRIVLNLSLAIAIFGGSAFADSYQVEFAASRNPENKGQYRVARVSAEVTPTASGIVGLFRNNDDVGLPNGWSTFLYKPAARTLHGQPLALSPLGHGKMRVEGWQGGPIALDYTMLLQHDRFPNEPGDDELAYARDFGVMWTGRALLMEGAPATNIDVRFTVPKEWRITTPWREDATNPYHFVAESTDDLLDSAIMAGTQEQLIESIGTAEARIGVDPAMHQKKEDLVRTLHQSIAAYQSMFRDLPHNNVAILLSGASFTGGGVMGRSISFLIGPDYPDPKEFQHVLSHELFHLWTGRWNRAAQKEQTEWLVEGAAEYYSYLSGLRSGRLSTDEFLMELATRYARYRKALETTAIGAAGTTKLQQEPSSDAVYSGGMIALFTLDALIRRHSSNRDALDNAMRSLNAKSKVGPLTLDELREVLSESGVQPDFLARYISSRTPLPMAEALSYFGLALEPAGDNFRIERMTSRRQDGTRNWLAYSTANR